MFLHSISNEAFGKQTCHRCVCDNEFIFKQTSAVCGIWNGAIEQGMILGHAIWVSHPCWHGLTNQGLHCNACLKSNSTEMKNFRLSSEFRPFYFWLVKGSCYFLQIKKEWLLSTLSVSENTVPKSVLESQTSGVRWECHNMPKKTWIQVSDLSVITLTPE